MESLVIIPTYNEIENIRDIIEAVFGLDNNFHLLIVDDGSPDGTAEAVQEMMKVHSDRLFLIQRKGKLGLGTAYLEGFRYALQNGYELIYEMDADFSHNPNDLLTLREKCLKDADVVIGSRYVTGVNVVNWPMGRVLMSYFASWYVRIITGMPFRDSTAGFKCYRRQVLETIDLSKVRFIGYAFQIEMKFLAWKHGFNVQEVPIIFTERTRGKSKMSPRIFKEAILGVIEMTVRSFFKKFEPKVA